MKIVIAACVLAMATAASAQQVSSLQGRVVRWGTSEPLGKVSIELHPAAANGIPAPFIATTNGDGAFVFASVPSGQYRVVALRPGFVNAEYGQRWPGRAGTPLTLPPGQVVSNVPIPMLPTGAISGMVRDPFGQPLGNAEVTAYKATFQTGRRVLTRVQSVQSDDRGEYRLFWLTPGRYFVAARHADLSNSPIRVGGISIGGGGGVGPGGGQVRYQRFNTGGDNASASRFNMLDQQAPVREKYVAVYYPNTSDESSAGAIEVAPGGETRAIDFAVAPQIMQRVRGRVVYEANNEPAMSARVQFVTPTGFSPVDEERGVFGPFAGALAVQCCDGAFELGLPSGRYTLVAGVGNLYARTSVTVSDGDVDGVMLALGRSFNIKGTVTFEGRAPAPAELNAMRLNVVADPPVAGLAPVGYSNVLPNGSFTLQAGRGDFRLSLTPLLAAPGGFPLPAPPAANPPASLKDVYVKSIRLGSVDVLNRGLHLDGETTDLLEIVLGTAAGALEGRVLNANRQPVPNIIVALVPDLAHRARVDLIKSTSADASGRFRIGSIPPGDYVAFAFDGVADGEWQDPAYLAARESRGLAIKISAEPTPTVELQTLTE